MFSSIYLETGQMINDRYNWHKTFFKNHKKCGFCRILSDHFDKRVCKNAVHTVKILEKLDVNWRSAYGALDSSITSKRKQKEKE